MDALLRGAPCVINGDGETTRLLPCSQRGAGQHAGRHHGHPHALGRVYNVAMGKATTLNGYFVLLPATAWRSMTPALPERSPSTGQRAGDVRHSVADVGAVKAALGYAPMRAAAGLHSLLAVREVDPLEKHASSPFVNVDCRACQSVRLAQDRDWPLCSSVCQLAAADCIGASPGACLAS